MTTTTMPDGYKIIIRTLGGETHWELCDSGGHLAEGFADTVAECATAAVAKANELFAAKNEG